MSSLNKMHNEAQNPRIGPFGPQEAGGTGHSLRTAWRGREGRQGRGGEEDLQSLPDFTLPLPTAPPCQDHQDHQDHEVRAEEGGDQSKRPKGRVFKDRKDSRLVPTDADPVDLGSQLCLPLTPPPSQIIKK